jgi:hypothetical protein
MESKGRGVLDPPLFAEDDEFVGRNSEAYSAMPVRRPAQIPASGRTKHGLAGYRAPRADLILRSLRSKRLEG